MVRFSIIGLTLVLLTACSSCTHRNTSYDARWPATDDPAARIAQGLLDQTVKVEVRALVSFIPLKEARPDDTVNMPDQDFIGGSGSGTVVIVEHVAGHYESLVLTAYHVCHVPEEIKLPFGLPSLPVLETSLDTINSAGKKMSATIMYKNEKNDVCVIKVEGLAGKIASLAKEMPPVGANIIHAGAPTGTFGKHLGAIVPGRYLGIESTTIGFLVTMALPTEPGSSGGGVYYNGKLFSTLNWSSGPGGNISWGVELDHIQAAMIEAKNIWKNTRDN